MRLVAGLAVILLFFSFVFLGLWWFGGDEVYPSSGVPAGSSCRGYRGPLDRHPMNGTSMLPAMREGDAALVAPGLVPNLWDVGVVESDGLLVAHRVVAIDQGRYVLKGDNNPRRDRDVYGPGDFLGTVCGVVVGGAV